MPEPWILFFNAKSHNNDGNDEWNKWTVGRLEHSGYYVSDCIDCDVEDGESFATFDEAVARLRERMGEAAAVGEGEDEQ